MNQAQQLMAELEENGFSFYGARRNLALAIMEKHIAAAVPMMTVVPEEPHAE